MKEILGAIERAAVRIKQEIDTKDIGYSQHQNATGDTQLQLDITCDLIVEEELSQARTVNTIVSEEQDDAFVMNESARYFVAFDPLDGSSLIDVNLSVGSIFGIYDASFSVKNLVAACYVVYGPRTELVFAHDGQVKFYLLQEGIFVFVKNILLDKRGKLNAPGGTQQNWPPYHKAMVDGLFQEGYRLRYSGGMVPDLHQILLKGGGLFSYPSTSDRPEGKLRMLYEALPFAFIFSMAGGDQTDGKNDLLTMEARHIHDTTPCFFGSKYEIERVKDVYARN
ncbi:MAG: class 1 fructose-bisphosphatase [Thiovulaceae bacterium]|nr:class 1 fructose-bisphosphatase [Sulfurimonadaceae bacterium]